MLCSNSVVCQKFFSDCHSRTCLPRSILSLRLPLRTDWQDSVQTDRPACMHSLPRVSPRSCRHSEIHASSENLGMPSCRYCSTCTSSWNTMLISWMVVRTESYFNARVAELRSLATRGDPWVFLCASSFLE